MQAQARECRSRSRGAVFGFAGRSLLGVARTYVYVYNGRGVTWGDCRLSMVMRCGKWSMLLMIMREKMTGITDQVRCFFTAFFLFVQSFKLPPAFYKKKIGIFASGYIVRISESILDTRVKGLNNTVAQVVASYEDMVTYALYLFRDIVYTC